MKNTQKGFTLIELLVVISIIFLLTSVFISNAKEARAKAKDAAKIAQARQVQNALAIYESGNKGTPFSKIYNAKDYSSPSALYSRGSVPFNTAMEELDIEIPEDDENFSTISYYDDGTNATLIATLESDASQENNDGCITSNSEFDCETETDDDGNLIVTLLDSNGDEIGSWTQVSNDDDDDGDDGGGDFAYEEISVNLCGIATTYNAVSAFDKILYTDTVCSDPAAIVTEDPEKLVINENNEVTYKWTCTLGSKSKECNAVPYPFNDPQYDCVDNEGGKDIYTKGTIITPNVAAKDGINLYLPPTFDPTSLEPQMVTIPDSCAGNTLLEWSCPTDESPDSMQSISCPNGCSNGACIE